MAKQDDVTRPGKDLRQARPTSRREILSLGAAAAVGAVAATLLSDDEVRAEHGGGEDPDSLHVGELNETEKTSPTRLRASVAFDALGEIGPNPPGSVLEAFNLGTGWGAIGHGAVDSEGGILGSSAGDGPGVMGSSQTGPGVHGNSLNGPGVQGTSPSATSPAIVGLWTGLADSPTPHSGVFGASSAGPGVHGSSASIGVFGKAAAVGPGEPVPTNGIGVSGESGGGPGVQGVSFSGPGVSGHSGTGAGVRGQTDEGVGVFGLGDNDGTDGIRGVTSAGQSGSGVRGRAFGDGAPITGLTGLVGVNGAGRDYGVAGASNDGIGVQGFSQTGRGVVAQGEGLALDVIGKARFSTSGSGSAPSGASSHDVAEPSVTAKSHVSVTLTSDPGRKVIHWVGHDPGVGFSIHFASLVGPGQPPGQSDHAPISFTYLITEFP